MTNPTLNRRTFVGLGAGALGATLLRAKPASAAPPLFTYYWNTAPGAHEPLREHWTGQGYRPQCVTMMGTSADPRVNALWIKRNGPAFAVYVNVSLADLGPYIDIFDWFGYRVTQLSATGTQADPRFSIVMEVSDDTSRVLPALRHSTSMADAANTDTIEYWTNWAFTNHWIPVSIACYGDVLNPRYSLLLHPNPSRVTWNLAGLNELAANLTRRNLAQFGHRGRPAAVHASSAQRYSTIYRNDLLSPTSELRHDMTAAQLNMALQSWATREFYPVHLSATTVAGAARYSVIAAHNESVLQRITTRSGPDRSSPVDEAMLSIMRDNGVRQGALAITNNQRLIYTRAFNFSESSYPGVTNTSRFRIASCSKMLTAMLIMEHVQRGVGTVGGVPLHRRTIHSVLGLTMPNGGQPIATYRNHTIEDAMLFRTRIPAFVSHWDVAAAFPGQTIDAARTARFALSLPPMAAAGYSNTAFVMLGLVIERLNPGRTYMQVLRDRILTPLGITRVDQFPAPISSQPVAEAFYDTRTLDIGPSVLSPAAPWVPGPYGAMFDPAVWVASGGLTGAAPDFAMIAASFSRPGAVLDATHIDLMLTQRYGFGGGDNTPGGPINGFKDGGMSGTAANIHVVRNGISFFVAFNKNIADSRYLGVFQTMRDAVARTVWNPPNENLFPVVGLPPL